MEHTLLVITAHPYDESFPIGGTIAKYASEGVRVVLVCATRGEAGIPGLSASESALIRENELREAAGILGINRLEFFNYLDGTLARVDEEEIVTKLLAIFQKEKPQAVITFDPTGLSGHPDHVAINRYTTKAFERAKLPARLFYIMPSEATQQGCGVIPSHDMNVGLVTSIDINKFTEIKVRAMQSHISQNPPYQGDPVKEAKKLACHEFFILEKSTFPHQHTIVNLFE